MLSTFEIDIKSSNIFLAFFTHWYIKLKFVSSTSKIPKISHCTYIYNKEMFVIFSEKKTSLIDIFLNPTWTEGRPIWPPPGIGHLLCSEWCTYELQTFFNYDLNLPQNFFSYFFQLL